MDPDYPAIDITRRNGDESFLFDEKPIGPSLLEFWKWSGSDLTGNTARGILAEYIVATALGIDEGVRIEWAPVDLTYCGVGLEVKSSSYIQTWYQKKASAISFGIQRTRTWDAKTNTMVGELRRQADVYVFCVLAHLGPTPLNPMDLNQWDFYVLPTSVLNEKCETQKTIGLSRLKSFGAKPIKYAELAASIHAIMPRSEPS